MLKKKESILYTTPGSVEDDIVSMVGIRLEALSGVRDDRHHTKTIAGRVGCSTNNCNNKEHRDN